MRYKFKRLDGREGSITDTTHPAKITQLVEEGCVFTPPLPASLIGEAASQVAQRDARDAERRAAFAAVGLTAEGRVPAGHGLIWKAGVDHPERRDDHTWTAGARVRDGIVWARLAWYDAPDGGDAYAIIVGTYPIPMTTSAETGKPRVFTQDSKGNLYEDGVEID